MSLYDPFGFNEMDKRHDRWQQKVKQEFLPGIDPADLKPGMRVTISPNLRREDNSWTDTVHTILAVNQMHVQTKLDRNWSDKPVMLLTIDHHFYDASHFQSEVEEAK